MLIAARFVQGAGAAAMMPQIMSVIQLRFSGTARARAAGRGGDPLLSLAVFRSPGLLPGLAALTLLMVAYGGFRDGTSDAGGRLPAGDTRYIVDRDYGFRCGSGAEGMMASGNEMRVGDAERDAAAAELREHFASGRLTQEELDERIDRVFAAKTRADLAGVFTDLPSAGAGAGSSRAWTEAGGPRGQSWSGGSGGPFGPQGLFGASGPFGASGARGPFGACGPMAAQGWRSAGRAIFVGMMLSVAMFVMFMVGILGVFGVGVARPIGILLVVLAFVLRRVFGFRRGPRGPRRRRW